MLKAHVVAPERDIGTLLTRADFVDAYQVEADCRIPDAKTAARAMIKQSPVWARALLALRNTLVRPLGLKVDKRPNDTAERIGFFSVIWETERRIVLGLDDRHLDFRSVVDVVDAGAGSRITLTTLVRFNNPFGRAYLTLILPFHRLIVQSWLNRLATQSAVSSH